VDISVAGLVAPYRLIDADWPPLAESMEEFARCFHWPSGGMGRYPGDHFEGGHPWPLCSMWLAAYFLACGETERALENMEWALEQTTPLGHFPEQVHKQSLHWVSALPLGWAHAWYLWLVDSLYLKIPRSAAPEEPSVSTGGVRGLLQRAPLLRSKW
jgi:GH15 family glucan-1,4-alpha-glucosidase